MITPKAASHAIGMDHGRHLHKQQKKKHTNQKLAPGKSSPVPKASASPTVKVNVLGLASRLTKISNNKASKVHAKEQLCAYREKMGIEVQSEKDHINVIKEVFELAGRAMQHGSYISGVCVLEKVTQYCSTQSKLGGKAFLGLAMAYEAEGKTGKAIGLYTALIKSPIEQIKMNADTLLCGLEAMNSM